MPDRYSPLADVDEIFNAFVAFDKIVESADVKILALSEILFLCFAEDHVMVNNFFDFSAGVL